MEEKMEIVQLKKIQGVPQSSNMRGALFVHPEGSILGSLLVPCLQELPYVPFLETLKNGEMWASHASGEFL